MLNKDGQRELCYVVAIDKIEPITGSDNCEAAVVGGWRIMTRKGTFKPGDLAIYFEIDSKVPETEVFSFLEKKHYKVKTQKYTFGGKGNFVSQGLLMHPKDFDWDTYTNEEGVYCIFNPKKGASYPEGHFLTAELGVKYSDADDNKRKAASADKYKKMTQRKPELFSKPWARWMMNRNWGKKVMFFIFGKAKDKKGSFPAWVKKTDEERIQNMSWILANKDELFATEKIDGTSTTFTLKKEAWKKDYRVCSRNVSFDDPSKACYYDTNVYLAMSKRYNMEEVLEKLFEDFNEKYKTISFVTVQGETYGKDIQKRDYDMDDHDFMAFNLIIGFKEGPTKRFNPREMTDILEKYNIPCVPIVSEHFILPDTVDELLKIATGKSAIDGGMREGLVFRSYDGTNSFKAVSNEFLLRYHS